MSFVDDLIGRFRAPVVWREGEAVDHNKLNAMMRGFVRLVSVGPGLRKTESSDGEQVTISLSSDPKPLAGFWGIISSSAKESGKYRWEYTFNEVGPKTDVKWAGWSAADASQDRKAYNSAEYLNAVAADPLGNGLSPGDLLDSDHDGTPDNDALKPVPNGSPVWVRPVAAKDESGDLKIEFWFTFPNAAKAKPGGSSGLVPVRVQTDGGGPYVPGGTATYTYALYPIGSTSGGVAKNADGVTDSDMGQSPAWARQPYWASAATHGTAYYAADGKLTLYQVDEVEGWEFCDTATGG